jgi:competence ComEA-like helix-hairpin-helix protein
VFDLTPSERRGALTFVLLLALGAGWDLVRARYPEMIPLPAPAATPAPATPAVPAAPAAPAAPVDLNRAGVEELDTLPGIGPVLARRIVEHRAAHGPFRRPEDLLAVRGIGPRLFERLRGRVRVGAAALP